MKYYININKAMAIGALAIAGIAAAWYIVKETSKETKKLEELNDYKKKKLADIDQEINKATVDNEKIDNFKDRAIAKEVLYNLKDRVRNASSESEVDSRFNELTNEIDAFIQNDPVSVKASIIFHKARMDSIKEEASIVQKQTFEKEKIIEGGKVAATLIRTVGTYL